MTPEQKAARLLRKGYVKAPKWIQGGEANRVNWVLRSKPKAYWA